METETLQHEIARYLETKGYNVIIIDKLRVRSRGELKHNYELYCEFTATKVQ